MTSITPEGRDSATPLSEDQRAAAFALANAPVGRGGVTRVGRPPIPPKFVAFVAAVFVVLGLGGVVVEHFYGGVGTTGTTTTVFTLAPTPVAPTGPQLNASTRSFLGLKQIESATASPIVLRDESGRVWSLANQRGKVVVLTFLNINCNDICPVEGAEIRQALSLLGVNASKIVFAIVNSDPNHVSGETRPAALAATGLAAFTSVHFLTGPLNQLNAVWISYGVEVKTGVLANEVAHNNVMYFISPKGALHSLVIPFGNQNHAGVFSLSATEIRRFARGIATEAVSLAK